MQSGLFGDARGGCERVRQLIPLRNPCRLSKFSTLLELKDLKARRQFAKDAKCFADPLDNPDILHRCGLDAKDSNARKFAAPAEASKPAGGKGKVAFLSFVCTDSAAQMLRSLKNSSVVYVCSAM